MLQKCNINFKEIFSYSTYTVYKSVDKLLITL